MNNINTKKIKWLLAALLLGSATITFADDGFQCSADGKTYSVKIKAEVGVVTCDEQPQATITKEGDIWTIAGLENGKERTIRATDPRSACSTYMAVFKQCECPPMTLDLSLFPEKVLAGKEDLVVSAVTSEEPKSVVWTRNGVVIDEKELVFSDIIYVDTKYGIVATGNCNTVQGEVTAQAVWQTAITPYDGNGMNTKFAEGMEIVVYNRFGEKVFEGPDGWDGVIYSKFAKQGVLADPGVYYYQVTVPGEVVKKGTIEVVKQ